MKKIILVVASILLLTGCSVEYNLTIEEENITENISIIPENDEENSMLNIYNKPEEVFLNSPVYSESNEKLEGVEYYSITKVLNANIYQMNLDYKYKFQDFINANIVNNSVSIFKFEKNGDIYILNTGANLKIFENYKSLNNVKISIKLSDKYQVILNNAITSENNEFIWYVDRSNFKTSPITLNFINLEEQKNNGQNSEPENNVGNNIENNLNNNENNLNNNENLEKLENTNDNIIIGALFIGFILVLILILFIKRLFLKQK